MFFRQIILFEGRLLANHEYINQRNTLFLQE